MRLLNKLKANIRLDDKISLQDRNAMHTACGKAIISGEHAVVYGAKAVAMPLSQLRMKINLEQVLNAKCKDQKLQIRLGDTPVANIIYDVIKDALQLLGLSETCLKIDGYSKVPIGAGLGSSASLCIALLKSLAYRFKINLSLRELSLMGNQLESRFHGNPSGLDTAVVAYEKCIVFSRNASQNLTMIDPLDIPKNVWKFALVDSGFRASTLSMVEKAKPYFYGSSGDRLIERFNDLTENIIKGMLNIEHDLVEYSINEACKCLDGIGVVTDRLWDVIENCKKAGIKAVKPTGAGGGGAVLVLLDPVDYKAQFSRLQGIFGANRVFDARL